MQGHSYLLQINKPFSKKNIQLISSFPEHLITDNMIQDTIDKRGNIDYIINIAGKDDLIGLQYDNGVEIYRFESIVKE